MFEFEPHRSDNPVSSLKRDLDVLGEGQVMRLMKESTDIKASVGDRKEARDRTTSIRLGLSEWVLWIASNRNEHMRDWDLLDNDKRSHYLAA